MTCPFCAEPPDAETWWAWQEDPEGTFRARGEALRKHMENHRPLQPPHPRPWRARDYEGAAAKLSERQRRILGLLRGGGALSVDQLAAFLFRDADQKASSKTSQDMRILLRSQFVYRLFLEHLPGEGPRPAKPPALFFLGKSSRVVLEGQLRKRHEWFETIDDFTSWKEPYELWQSNARAAAIVRTWKEAVPLGLRTKGLRQTFQDQLLGRTSIQPDSLLTARYKDSDFALYIFRDNFMRSPEEEITRIVRFGALLRSGTQTPTAALVPAKSIERGKDLLRAASNHALPESTQILVCPEEELQKESPSWRSMVHGERGSIEYFLDLLLGKKDKQTLPGI